MFENICCYKQNYYHEAGSEKEKSENVIIYVNFKTKEKFRKLKLKYLFSLITIIEI